MRKKNSSWSSTSGIKAINVINSAANKCNEYVHIVHIYARLLCDITQVTMLFVVSEHLFVTTENS